FKMELPEARTDGEDISGILLGSPAAERTIFWKYRKQTALRKGGWKLMNGEELYNLAADSKEQKDLAAAYPEKVKELQELFDKIALSLDK
ncbi:MAG TPA: hypothetical protein VD772_08245, partial [Anseongella sp.]|nr:hypothetical protein [Anseongella sp.]